MEIEIYRFSRMSFFGEKLSKRKYNMIFETWKKSPMKFFDLTPKIANLIKWGRGKYLLVCGDDGIKKPNSKKYHIFKNHLANVVLAGNKGIKKIVLRESEAGKFFAREIFSWKKYYGENGYMGRLLKYLISHGFYVDKKISYLFPLIVDSNPAETLRFMITKATRFLANPNVQAIFNEYVGKIKINLYFHEVHLLEKNSDKETISWVMKNFLDENEWRIEYDDVSRRLQKIRLDELL